MSGGRIAEVVAWECLDSRGTPTVGCRVALRSGAEGRAIVPSGASTGAHEAVELRDGGERHGGRGVRAAVRAAEGPLAEAVRGLDAGDGRAVDDALVQADGTPDLGRLGGNAVLAVSLAAALAAAADARAPLWRHLAARCGAAAPSLPLPMVNVLSGGAHAAGALDLQDFLVVPVGAASFAEAIDVATRVRRAAAELVAERGLVHALVADEGGIGAPLGSGRAAVELLHRAIERAGLAPGDDAAIAIDVAATQLLDGDAYALRAEGRRVAAAAWVEELAAWCDAHPIVSLEDPLAEDDWAGWATASAALDGRCQLLGDDLFTTDPARLERGIEAGIANAILVKPNQAGTLTRALDALDLALRHGYAPVVSARSGDTEDTWLADLAVGTGAGQIKVGSTMRSERTAKWNRLLELERTTDLPFAGAGALTRGGGAACGTSECGLDFPPRKRSVIRVRDGGDGQCD